MARVLEEEHFSVDVANDGETGLDMALRGVHAVAIIDWMLPGRDGPSICRAIRSSRLPIALLMLTARGQIEDRVLGLDSGADDYLTKPFAFEELLARVRALSRRFTVAAGNGSELRLGDIVLDLRAHTARHAEQTLELTPTEWNLLECLMRYPGQTLTRQQILDHVWPYDSEVRQTIVDVYVAYLRRKLDLPGSRNPVETVRGVGYRLKG
jgi:DNA-binding response OmpR family regulator